MLSNERTTSAQALLARCLESRRTHRDWVRCIPGEGPGQSPIDEELDFLGGVTDQNLWFMQSGNDLKIDLLGTATSATLDGWFAGGSNELQEITVGGLKIDSQISQLVQAMATYAANNPGFDPASSTLQTIPNDTGLHNAIAAAWHA